MDTENIESALKDYGLSEKEARIYIICLRFGSASVVSISRKAKLPKSTCYDLLNALSEKGLVSTIIKNGARFFEASNPAVFTDALDEKKKQIESVLPSLVAIKNSVVEKPNVTFYEGIDGIRTIFNDIISSGKDVRILGNFSNFKNVARHVAPRFIEQRVAKKIFCKYISEASAISRKVKKADKKELRETRITDLMNNQNAECYIYGTKVALVVMSRDEPVGVIIDNQHIAGLQTMLFENLWGVSK